MDKFNYHDILNPDMFNFDKEQNILKLMLMHLDSYKDDILLFKGNSFERKVLRYIKKIDSFTENNGHECLPPDYYSDEFSCMFDVLRINDSEVKKKNNPVLAKEKKAKKEFENALREEFGKDDEAETILNSPYLQFIHIADSSEDVNEHSYPNYKKQAQRVIAEHIKKVPIWEKEHQDIKYKGLLIFDESGLCFEGIKNHIKDDYFSYAFKSPPVIHESWNDREFIHQIYESTLDFVIWFTPYKAYSQVLCEYNKKRTDKSGVKYPVITIIDTRFKRTEYKEYNYVELVMDT